MARFFERMADMRKQDEQTQEQAWFDAMVLEMIRKGRNGNN